MKIYRVTLDVNNYQSFFPDDEKIWQTETLNMDSTSKLSGWIPPKIYILKPKLKRGNFFYFCAGGLVIDKIACEKLRSFWEMSGELLPLEYKGEEFFLFNTLECINVLDDEKTEWILGKTSGKKIRIDKYVFKENRMTESPIFKIPETVKGEILTFEGMKAPEDEFKYVVEQENLKGLIFEEIWDSSDSIK